MATYMLHIPPTKILVDLPSARRPDMTITVDWGLNNNYLSIYPKRSQKEKKRKKEPHKMHTFRKMEVY